MHNTAEGRGNKAAEDDNKDNVLRYESKAKPKGVATRLRKTTGKPESE